MKIKILFILILLFFIGSALATSENLTEYTIIVLDENQSPIANANIKIGDLDLFTNSKGKTSLQLYPALYDMSITKENYFTLSKNIDFSIERQKTFILEKDFFYLNISIIDEDTKSSLFADVNLINVDTKETSSIDLSTSPTSIKLKKSEKYFLEIDHNDYVKQTLNIEYNKIIDDFLIITLKKKTSIVNFSLNIESGIIKFFDKNENLLKEETFNENFYSSKLSYGEYFIEINNSNYFSLSQSITIDDFIKNYSFSLNAKQKVFQIYFELNSIQDLIFLDDFQNYIPKTSILPTNFIIKQGDKIITTGSAITVGAVTLEEGTYDLYAENPFAYPFVKKQLNISKTSKNNFLVKLKKLPVYISGNINFPTTQGAIDIIFEDEKNHLYSTLSDKNGIFNAFLPVGNYKIKIENSHYSLKEKDDSFSFEVPGKTYSLSLNAENLDSFISGHIKSTNNIPLANAKINIKVGKSEKTIFSDENGFFSTDVKNGLAVIKAYKNGYYSKGNVKKIHPQSQNENFNFYLEEILSSVTGTITNGIIPINNIKVILKNTTTDTELSTFSNDDGSFTFKDVSVSGNYILLINDINYTDFTSDNFNISENKSKNINIILNKKTLDVIFEIKNTDDNPLSTTEVFFNDIRYETDINGLVEIELNKIDNKYSVKVEIPEFNFSNLLHFDENSVSPLTQLIVLK